MMAVAASAGNRERGLVCSAASSEAFVEASSGENPATPGARSVSNASASTGICASLSACVPGEPVAAGSAVGWFSAPLTGVSFGVSGSEAGVKPGPAVVLECSASSSAIARPRFGALVKERSALRNGFRPLALTLQTNVTSSAGRVCNRLLCPL